MECLTSVLNKLYAMHAVKIVTLKDIAKAVKEPQQRISEWVTQRHHAPNGNAAFKLHDFASRQTIRIAMNRKMGVRYRAAYRLICARFPVEGKK